MIFSSTGASRWRRRACCLVEHLGVAGDDGERGVDLVRDAGGEQADGGELFGLGELRFELDAVGDVVDQDDAADGDEVAGDQRRDGDVGGAGLAGGQCEAELVEGVGAVLVAQRCRSGATKSAGKTAESGWRRASARGCGVHDLHLGVPALDAVVEVDGEDADVDGFDDVLVELLEPLELGDLLLRGGGRAGRSGWRCRCSRRAIRAAPCLRWRGSRRRRCGRGR